MSRVGRLGTTLGASHRCIGATRRSLPLALLHGGVVRDEWANNAPLRLSRRCQTMKRNLNPPLHCVSRKLGDEDCIFANIKDQDVDANNNNSGTTTEKDEDVLTDAAEDASEAEAIVVDITAMEAALLEKRLPSTLVRGSVECLNPAERRSLTKLIYDAFYKSLATSTDRDEAAGLMYQAGLELQWLEEWAAQSTSGNTRASLEERRRKVKMAALERVDLHKPLSYIIGSQPFFGCTIGCEAPLLCPRPETEMWAHWLTKHHLAKANKAGARVDVLDMCCGTGCIGVSLAKNVPSAHVFAVDLLESAVLCSLRNAEMNGISSSRYTAVHSDMFDCFCEGAPASPPSPTTTTTTTTSTSDEVTEAPFVVTPLRQGEAARFDVVVSNPPYVLPEQYENLPRGITLWESKMALVGDARREHQQYRYFQELTERGAELLKRDADRHPSLWGCPSLVVEVGLQARLVASLMERSGRWREVCVHLDYAQQERWISAILA